MASVAERLLVSACALTRTTEWATRLFGPRRFLPALFSDRFTHLGGIERAVFERQLSGCRSFADDRWTPYWEALAAEHLAVADAALSTLGGPSTRQLLNPSAADTSVLGELLAPAVEILADRGAIAPKRAVPEFSARHPESLTAATALDALIKAMVYEFVAAWPGWTPQRLRAYETSHRLGEVLVTALAPAMGVDVEVVRIPLGGDDAVRGYLMTPQGADRVPTVLVTNGVEGTLAEAMLPVLAHRDRGMGVFVMEMPGTYSYREPLAPAAERVYTTVLDYLSAHDRVDADRLAMMGLSFGGYWATRMAATDRRLRVAIANGAPTHRSFQIGSATGLPEIMVSTLRSATGATSVVDLTRRLTAMSLRAYYSRIEIPMLVINGTDDTLIATRDSIDIAAAAPRAQLALYAGDDHCAMGHADQWMELSIRFLAEHLAVAEQVAR
ncbi:alpha/beta hydrolase family protein [Nocardia brasiliensis]|uniref:alpha/beta hydrolase family protein n=1 Tax=Nocardia brasiliensis TaxID=37326 RepID=UPI0037B2925A